MKQLFCLLGIALYGCISVPLGDLEQQNVFTFEGMDKPQLLQKSSAWVSTSFRTNKTVLRSIDPETGKLIVSASTSWNSMLSTLTVYVQILIIELFAREKTEGWDAWGNEVESDIDLLSVAQQDVAPKV